MHAVSDTDRQFLGHPRGLAFLGFTEAWERFSYYGMQTLLVLYLSRKLLLPGHIENILGFTGFRAGLESAYGHTLSVIALKAELAGRLLPHDPAAAGREVGEVEQVARQALGEVRQAVSGYWQPTLDGELEGARMALSAAGITAEVQRSEATLDPEVEAVLAWAIREGATNVIRHSGARHCTIEIGASAQEAAVEVLDDGQGTAMSNGNGGHGLAGLSERAESLSGTVEVGSRPEGGFRLAVTVPVAAP